MPSPRAGVPSGAVRFHTSGAPTSGTLMSVVVRTCSSGSTARTPGSRLTRSASPAGIDTARASTRSVRDRRSVTATPEASICASTASCAAATSDRRTATVRSASSVGSPEASIDPAGSPVRAAGSSSRIRYGAPSSGSAPTASRRRSRWHGEGQERQQDGQRGEHGAPGRAAPPEKERHAGQPRSATGVVGRSRVADYRQGGISPRAGLARQDRPDRLGVKPGNTCAEDAPRRVVTTSLSTLR